MNTAKISIQNIRSKPLHSLLSIILICFSVGLLSILFHLQKIANDKIDTASSGIDMVVGAKGSPLQLVMSAVLHMDAPTGNIDYSEAIKIARNKLIKKAIPISYGDNYKNYRIVGTEKEYLSIFSAEIEKGRHFQAPFEVVLGASVAKQCDLIVGDTFTSSHGFSNDLIPEKHEQLFRVVGILKPSKLVIDGLIITPLESIWEVHDSHSHEEDHKHDDSETHEHDHESAPREITALLVQFKNAMGMMSIPRKINTNTNLQAALPKYELEKLYNATGIGVEVLHWIAYVLFIVSILSILISIFKIIKERTYELALLRVYGASVSQLILLIFWETLLICIAGFTFGILFSRLGLRTILKNMQEQFKQQIATSIWLIEETYLLLFILSLVCFVVILAILPILRINVSKTLSDEN